MMLARTSSPAIFSQRNSHWVRCNIPSGFNWDGNGNPPFPIAKTSSKMLDSRVYRRVCRSWQFFLWVPNVSQSIVVFFKSATATELNHQTLMFVAFFPFLFFAPRERKTGGIWRNLRVSTTNQCLADQLRATPPPNANPPVSKKAFIFRDYCI